MTVRQLATPMIKSCDAQAPCCARRASRRRFGAAASAVGLALGSGLAGLGVPLTAQAQATAPADPKPITGGIQLAPGAPLIHVFPPMPGLEPSTITDFNGVIGITD